MNSKSLVNHFVQDHPYFGKIATNKQKNQDTPQKFYYRFMYIAEP